MNKEQLLTTIKENLQQNFISKEDLYQIISETRCYFCQMLLQVKEFNQLNFWNEISEDKRLICYVCLKYLHQKNLPLLSASKRELFIEYERDKLFKN